MLSALLAASARQAARVAVRGTAKAALALPLCLPLPLLVLPVTVVVVPLPLLVLAAAATVVALLRMLLLLLLLAVVVGLVTAWQRVCRRASERAKQRKGALCGSREQCISSKRRN